ncbi:rhodanese-like domain-containing protein [Clostridium sp. AN503]|uniref:rhodanese-like domain-containing protein n=1 Tax=Clostridium sp. AN503 TaxID=3160598 RepID=UPI003458E245
MNRYIAIGLSVAAALLLAACTRSHKGTAAAAPEESGSAYHKITAEEAKEMMDSGDVTVVDVRRAEEYEQAHIPGAVLVPNESIGEEQPEELPDKDAAILVHCRTGVRSKQASDKLVKMGYTNIYDFGGIVDWPYETEGGEAN